MALIVHQQVDLPASAKRLFEMYLDAEQHAALTGAPVIIGPNPGDKFEAFNGALSGSMIAVVTPRLIVQAWRSLHFYETDPDSTLVLTFTDTSDGGRIDLVHINIPEQDYVGIKDGWPTHYWKPWRAYLEA